MANERLYVFVTPSKEIRMTSLGTPLSLRRGPAWPSRAALAPMTNRQSNADGTLSDDELAWLVHRARGGFGMVMTCASHVTANGQGWPGELGIFDDSHLDGLAALAAGIREAGAVSSVQLHHGGLRADADLVVDRVAPWDDPESGARALTTDEVHDLVDDFGRAAARAESAGFDGVEVHGAHGYLISQFLSRRNGRIDGYGGDLEGRSRFLMEIIDAVRVATGDDFQVGLRLSPERWGIHLDDAVELARRTMTAGSLDYLDMSLWDVFKKPVEHPTGERLLISSFVGLDRGETRLGVAGKILSGADVQFCLDQGADFVSIGTAAILHHDFATRAIGDERFESAAMPVGDDHLAGEAVGPAFVEYLHEIRSDVVTDR